MIKVGDKLLVAVKVISITENESGTFYKVASLNKWQYDTMIIYDNDIQSCLRQEAKEEVK